MARKAKEYTVTVTQKEIVDDNDLRDLQLRERTLIRLILEASLRRRERLLREGVLERAGDVKR